MNTSKKALLAIFLLMLAFSSCRNPASADPERITIFWERTYGDSLGDYARSVERTSDGGYIIAGVSWHFIDLPKAHILKVDGNGYVQWEKIISGERATDGYRICETNDGGFITVDITTSTAQLQFMRMDSAGDTLWTKLYSGPSLIVPHSLIAEADGDIFLACDLDGRLSLMKFDENAEFIWASTYQDISSGNCSSAMHTLDGCFIISGVEYGSPRRGVLIKADASGRQIWAHTYSMPGAQLSFRDVLPTLDGGYIVAGRVHLSTSLYDAYLLKVDSSGDSVWALTFGGDDDDEFNSVHQTASGNFIAVGMTRSYGIGSEDIYFELVDPNGNSIISFLHGGAGYESAFDIEETLDRRYVVVGNTSSIGAGDDDIFLLKIFAP